LLLDRLTVLLEISGASARPLIRCPRRHATIFFAAAWSISVSDLDLPK
jgi:hypothetical protein